ncbi:MAG: hypothetical protein KA287_06795 [Rhodoferax sp.]|nr:hypothetical protein [Rhodoferax sp.]MBP6493925.1 hypothetical protein [Rhodoferax sp.]HPW06539.1 hypothetical protein [Burkholderiaceae bacterium]
MKNLLTTFTLTIAALLCVSLTPTMVMAQAAAPASAAKKPAPPKPPVKPVAKAPAAKAPAAKAVAAQPAWPAQLASCKTEAGMNPIKREMCVWKFCKGNWGQGGCPEESKPGTSQPSN